MNVSSIGSGCPVSVLIDLRPASTTTRTYHAPGASPGGTTNPRVRRSTVPEGRGPGLVNRATSMGAGADPGSARDFRDNWIDSTQGPTAGALPAVFEGIVNTLARPA